MLPAGTVSLEVASSTKHVHFSCSEVQAVAAAPSKLGAAGSTAVVAGVTDTTAGRVLPVRGQRRHGRTSHRSSHTAAKVSCKYFTFSRLILGSRAASRGQDLFGSITCDETAAAHGIGCHGEVLAGQDVQPGHVAKRWHGNHSLPSKMNLRKQIKDLSQNGCRTRPES